MGFLSRFFDFFKAKNSQPEERRFREKARFEAQQPELTGQKGRSNVNDFLQLYRGAPWVHTCVRDIANAAASVDYQVLKDGKEIENKKDKIVRLVRKPNQFETFSDFRKKTFLHLELTGNCFWEISRDPKTDEIIALYILRPDWIKILPHPKRKVAGFLYEVPGSAPIPFAADEVLHLKYADAEDEYWGVPPLIAAQNEIIIDLYATIYNKTYFENGAEPGGVLETDFSITDATYERLINLWYKRHGGVKNRHIPAILEEGLKYKPIVVDHEKMQFMEQKKYNKEVIYEIYDIPLDWRKDLNQKKSFFFSNIIPKLNWLAETFNEYLLNPEDSGEDKDRFEIKFLTRSIEAMVEDEAVKAQVAQSNVTHGIMTQNEVRERYYGMKPVEWGDTYWAPVGLMEWDNPRRLGVAPAPTGQDVGRTADDDPRSTGIKSPNQAPKLNNPSASALDPNDIEALIDAEQAENNKEEKKEKSLNLTVNVQPPNLSVNIQKDKIEPIINVSPTPINVNVEKQDPPVVNVENKIENPIPVVNVENKVETPNVKVNVENKVEVEKQDLPAVNIVNEVKTPNVNVESPIVNVDIKPELKVPPTEETVKIIRDAKKQITGIIKETKPKEEEK